ncbi:MAG: PAS domain-containing protein [Polyangiaceae bacterium]|nr:PAS domain-containing protein [Polyangiaceae bacterium]
MGTGDDSDQRGGDTDPRLRALTERAAELEALISTARVSEVLLRSILDTVPDFVIKLSPDGIIHFVNRVAPGLAVTQVIGASIYDFILPGYQETARRSIERVMQTGAPDSYETVGLGAHGKPARYLTRLAPLKRGDEIESLVMIATDVTNLMESREKLEVALTASGLGIWSWERAGDTLNWDAATCAIFGVDAVPESIQDYLSLILPVDRERVEENVSQALESGTFADIEHRIVRPTGEVRWVMCKGRVELDPGGRPKRLIGGVVDVTERHSLQEQLVQAQKMEAVGQLAAGIAHNFNNMLTVMLSSMELATKQTEGETTALLRGGQEAALKAAQMVRQLLVFSGKARATSPRLEDIGALVQRTVEMSRTTFGGELSLGLRLSPDLPAVRCDAGQIEQALLNVLINARDAVEAREGAAPEIQVSVEALRAGADGVQEVRISISDNGSGMSDEVRRRVFEPFFTTKEPGRGTGLGLATAYAILREHGGRVECQSTPEVGTRMHLFLPAAPEARRASERPHEAAPRSGRGERVLVVDDEPMIRDLMSNVLGEAGYLVDTAVDGIDAIDRVRAGAHRYRVVLLDQSMPRLAGRAALRAIRALSPTLKIICFSGFPSSLEGADAVLQKPVPTQELLDTLEQVLGRR